MKANQNSPNLPNRDELMMMFIDFSIFMLVVGLFFVNTGAVTPIVFSEIRRLVR